MQPVTFHKPPLSPFAPDAAKHRTGYWLPWLILAISLALTYHLWKSARHNAIQVLQTDFDSRVREAIGDIDQRMQAYQQVLRGADGLFARTHFVTRDEFRNYFAHLMLKERYPGIQGVGYVQIVPRTEKDRHIAAVRRQGFPAYAIKPDGERDVYSSVVYLEPFDERNQRAFGYDMYSDNISPRPGDLAAGMRHAAMEQARDTGRSVITGKVRLLMELETDEQPQAGFLMYRPVYKFGMPHETLAERRANIAGWVYAPFRMNDLMGGILGEHANELDIDIYDGEEISERTLMYDPDHGRPGNSGSSALFKTFKPIKIANHSWTLTMHSRPGFEARLEGGKANLIAYGGVGISLLLALLTWLLVSGRDRAIKTAQAMNRELIKSENSLRTLLDTASEGVWITDADKRTVKVNRALLDMLEVSEQDVQNKTIQDFIDEESLAIFHNLMASTHDACNGQRYEIALRHADGGKVYCRFNTSPIRDEAGNCIGSFALVTDITERRAIEIQREQFFKFFTLSLDMMCIVGQDGLFKKVNPAFINTLGYPESELLQKPLTELIVADDQPATLKEVAKQVQGRVTLDFENRYHCKDGSFRWLSWRAFTSAADGLVYATARDITERKWNEQSLRTLSTAIEQSPIPIVVTDASANIQYINPCFTQITGYTSAEAIGRNPRMLQSGQTPKDTYVELWDKISSGQVWHGELLNRRKNGELYWEEAHIAPVTNLAGSVTHYVCLKIDVSERVKSRKAIERISLLYKMLSEVNSANIHATDRNSLFHNACRIAMETGLFRMAWVGLIDCESGNVFPVVKAGHTGDYFDNLDINIYHSTKGAGPTGMAIKNGCFVSSDDIANDPKMRPWRDAALKHGYRASIAFPLVHKEEVIGAFNLYAHEAGCFSEDIIQLLGSLAADISFTLDYIAESQERERAQREIQELSVFLQSALENERKRIARELHDELGQTMTALHFDLKWLYEHVNVQEGEIHAKLLSMRDLVSRTVDSIRRISEDLRPGMLDDLGLAAAIEHYVLKFSGQSGIECELLMSDLDFDLDEQVATALFRIVQEALTNVARHSGATHVTIRLQELETKILLIVQDNGRGLPDSRDAGKKTYGLMGMRERVKMIHGTLDIFNEAGAGARIEACVPKHMPKKLTYDTQDTDRR